MREMISVVVAVLALAAMWLGKLWLSVPWSSTLFHMGIAGAFVLPIYDLVTNGQMKNGIVLTPLTLLASTTAKLMGA